MSLRDQIEAKIAEARAAEKQARIDGDESGWAYHDGRADAYAGVLALLAAAAPHASALAAPSQTPQDPFAHDDDCEITMIARGNVLMVDRPIRCDCSRRIRASAVVTPDPTTAQNERVYPCAKCGVMRTTAEGGTIFTVCDACWPVVATPPTAHEKIGEALGLSENILVVPQPTAMQAQVEQLRKELGCRTDYTGTEWAMLQGYNEAIADVLALCRETPEQETT